MGGQNRSECNLPRLLRPATGTEDWLDCFILHSMDGSPETQILVHKTAKVQVLITTFQFQFNKFFHLGMCLKRHVDAFQWKASVSIPVLSEILRVECFGFKGLWMHLNLHCNVATAMCHFVPLSSSHNAGGNRRIASTEPSKIGHALFSELLPLSYIKLTRLSFEAVRRYRWRAVS